MNSSNMKMNQSSEFDLTKKREDLTNSINTLKDSVNRREQLKDFFQSFKIEIQKVYLHELPATAERITHVHNEMFRERMQHLDITQCLETMLLSSANKGVNIQKAIDVENECISVLENEYSCVSKSTSSMKESLAKLQERNAALAWSRKVKVQLMYQLNQANHVLERYKERMLTERLATIEASRKTLFNIYQECRGNIRVYCRIRPPKENELEHRFTITQGTSLKICGPERANMGGGKPSSNEFGFQFDRIFDQHVTQSIVFKDIWHLVQSCLDGYNVTLFAYGSTGSGKTYTMQGNSRPSEIRGIIPRVIERCLQERNLKQKRQLVDIQMWYSYFEIYNEVIRDLLNNGSVVEVKDRASSFHIPNLTWLPLQNIDDAVNQFYSIAGTRIVAGTKCNDQSSRSHAIYQIKFETSSGTGTDSYRRNTLALIDLAGSERLNKSGVTGQRQLEAKSINLSLTALNDMMSALGQAQRNHIAKKEVSHIPFRQSKLTQILKTPICGQSSKIAMFVNISSNSDDLQESLNSLRFATKVNGTKIFKRHLL